MAFDMNAYQKDYQRQNYDRVVALVPKGRGKDIKALAIAQGKSVSQVIVEAMEAYWRLDLSKVDGV